ncbi:MAG: hypothetical protein WC489_06875 [Patescibacteria group bacterium]
MITEVVANSNDPLPNIDCDRTPALTTHDSLPATAYELYDNPLLAVPAIVEFTVVYPNVNSDGSSPTQNGQSTLSALATPTSRVRAITITNSLFIFVWFYNTTLYLFWNF